MNDPDVIQPSAARFYWARFADALIVLACFGSAAIAPIAAEFDPIATVIGCCLWLAVGCGGIVHIVRQIRARNAALRQKSPDEERAYKLLYNPDRRSKGRPEQQ